MSSFFDLHRHDEFSFFDGFGKPRELAKIAKDLGYKALGTSNHGSMSGLVQHWKACKEVGIKPILGSEIYFQPVFDKENPKRKTFHLCLFVKNIVGYKNLCHLFTEANKNQFYYKPIVDLKLLKKYREGLICTTACVSGFISQAILNDNENMARKMLLKLEDIFCDDLYIEIQPYKVDKKGTQEKVNRGLIKLSGIHDIKCIFTSDSHYGEREDFDTYCKMHEIGKTTLDVKNTYHERYMPSEKEIKKRFIEMHKDDFVSPDKYAENFVENMQEIFDKVDSDILSECKLILPEIETDGRDSSKILKRLVKEGLQKKGKWLPEYKKRCLEELDTIHYHGFDDYFLMVQDYVNFAKNHGIAVGHGRGSACNCLVAYAVGVTEVDSIKYNLDFSRFMRKDKKKLPDIDVDFETDKRQEVIDYVVKKYEGKAVQICSYGEYSIDGLLNDLSGVCGLPMSGKDLDDYDKQYNKEKIAELKKFVRDFVVDGQLDTENLLCDVKTYEYNRLYDNIIKHFAKLHGKIRHLGQHAAGVAVVGSDISDYTCMMRKSRGKEVCYVSCYDLNDLESINCTKFDMLGLRTMSELFELEQYTGHRVTEEDRDHQEIYDMFREGLTDGIFQMEKSAPKKILGMIKCDCASDVIAVNALNRPAPLNLKLHEVYAYNKLSENQDTSSPYYQYTKETYGTMIYQEQTVEVAQKLGHLTAAQSFDMLKIMKKSENLYKPEYVPIIEQMRKDFFKGCRSEGLDKEQATEIWKSMLIYGFNKGHSVGYGLIAIDQMYYKWKYPTEFWYVKMKYGRTDADISKFSHLAAKSGVVVMLPHVNFSALTSMREIDGERVIQQGLCTHKGVGEKAAHFIEEEKEANGLYKTYDDFIDRCKGRVVTERVIKILKESGALEFSEKKYMSRVIKYNGTLIARR